MFRAMFAILASLVPAFARAQDFSAVANVEPSRAYVGASVRYSIVVSGTSDAETPRPVFPDGIDGRFAGATLMPAPTVIVNGQRQNAGPDRVLFQWAIVPEAAGEYVIPACSVTVGSQTITTQPAVLRVMDPAEPSDFTLAVELGKSEAFVGEPVPLRITWIVGRQPDDIHVQGSVDESDAVLYPVDASAQSSGVRGDREEVAVIPFMRTQAEAIVKSVVVNDEPRLAVVLEQLVIPSRAGELEIGPWSVSFRAPSETDPRRMERYVVRAPATTLRVKPLPPGAPEHFSGLVGRAAMLASAHPSEVNVGDPITLDLTIAAGAPIERIEAPDLAKQAGFTDLFKLESGDWQEVGAPVGGRTFRITIRARTSDLVEIPAIELPYLDPETGVYAIARTRPIPLDVADTPEVTAADALIASDAGDSGPSVRPLLDDARPGLLGNATGEALLRTDSPDPFAHLPRPLLLAAVAGPPAICVGAGLFCWWRTPRQRAWRRRRFAHARFGRRLRRAGKDPFAIAIAVRAYIADRFDRAPDALTEADCASLVTRSGATNGEDIAAFLRAGLRARYAGGLPDPNVSPRAARDLVAAINIKAGGARA